MDGPDDPEKMQMSLRPVIPFFMKSLILAKLYSSQRNFLENRHFNFL